MEEAENDAHLEGREDEEIEDRVDERLEELNVVEAPAERKNLREEATSIQHLLTHLPKNPYCMSCQQAKMRQRYSHRGAFKRELDQFGEIITCDHVVTPSMRMQGLGGERYGLSVRDLSTGLINLYPQISKGSEETTQALK